MAGDGNTKLAVKLGKMRNRNLEKMSRGGVYDQVGGGFHRYATERRWLVPHFEKMLYDQALLAIAYTEAWQATQRPDFVQTATEILDYVLRDMQDAAGGSMLPKMGQ